MKKLIVIKSSIVALAFALMVMTGCHQVNNTTPLALVGLHFHTFIDTNLVDPVLYSTQYFPDSLGRSEVLTTAQFYLTSLSFRNKSNQQWYTIPNSIILKREQNELYPVGNIPAATYDAIAFTVGLGNNLNYQDPSYYTGNSSLPSADSVLSTTEQAVMWLSNMSGMTGMASGYTFMIVQGYDSTDHTPFSYQIGGFGDTVRIILPYAAGFTIAPNEPSTLQPIHVIADYGKLLQFIHLNTASNGCFYSTTPANITNAANAWNYIIRMFRYECPTPNGSC